jgi:hypothetical protein
MIEAVVLEIEMVAVAAVGIAVVEMLVRRKEAR